MFSQFKNITVENSLHVEAGLALVSTFFESAERLATLNLNTSRSLLEQSVSNIKTMQEAKELKCFAGLQAAQTQPVIDAAIAYSRGIYEIASETKEEASKIVEVQFADVNAEVSELVDQVLERAPVGSEQAVAAIRTAIDAANSAYDRINTAAAQVVSLAEINISAASQASFKAAANAAKMPRKAA
jgi:phasin family protein